MGDCAIYSRLRRPSRRASTFPTFTYTGTYELIDDGISGGVQNWNIRFLTSGTLTFTDFGGASLFDMFWCGGGATGARGGAQYYGGQGGGGGHTLTKRGQTIELGHAYEITIGAGGVWTSGYNGVDGEATTAFGFTAEGGERGGLSNTGANVRGSGGSGGGTGGRNETTSSNGAGGDGGYDGGNGGLPNTSGAQTTGQGQGTTTREYGEATGRMYGCGGSGAGGYRSTSSWGKCGDVFTVDGDPTVYAGHGAGTPKAGGSRHGAESADPNTGGGGGGGNYGNMGWGADPGNGGSGIFCCRNARPVAA